MGTCFTIIAPDEYGAYEALGKFERILDPGMHFIVPWGRVRKLSSRLAENKVTTETKTKDNVFVNIHIAVQQEVHYEGAQSAFYRLSDPWAQIDAVVADAVRSQAPLMTLDALFEAKESIALQIKERLTQQMECYGYVIRQVLVTDIEPNDAVKAAMNQKFEQERLRAAAEQKAEADYSVAVRAAEAEAKSKELQGKGVANSRLAIVEGLKEAVGGQNMSPKEVTEVMLLTQYLDTLEKLSHGKATTVFMPHSVGGLSEVSAQIKKGVVAS
jgi:regulator of protease activity HflC (stomatin/prohibitin superfamily)